MKQPVTHIVFLHKVFPLGGAEQVTLAIANYLCQHGYKVTILAINHEKEAYHAGERNLSQVYTLPQGNIKCSKEVACAIRDFIRRQQVDVLVTYREILYARWLRRQTGVKLVYELHSTPYYECIDIGEKRRESRWKNAYYGCGIEWATRFFYRLKYRRIYRWCDAYGLLCEAYRQQMVSILSLGVKNKTWVLPNPIPLPTHVEYEKEKVMLFVGRLSHRDKRVDRLLRIWEIVESQLNDWQLKIVGDGKEAYNLKQLAATMGLERISFEGYSSQVADYYQSAAILCLTSSFEGWPMSVAEAQAYGVIPVVFDSFAGAADMISNEKEGIRVPPFDERLFARQLVSLATDEERQQAMRKAVIEKSHSYTVEKSGKVWEKMLGNLIHNHQSANTPKVKK